MTLAAASVLGLGLSLCSSTRADDGTLTRLQFRDGRFEPASLSVGANAPFRLQVTNSGPAPIEFESFELNRERVVAPGQAVTVFIPSLSPGTYHFFDDFHHEAGEGTLVAK